MSLLKIDDDTQADDDDATDQEYEDEVNGTAIKLTTTDEPDLIIPNFNKDNINNFKMGLKTRWTLELDGLVTLIRHTSDYDFIEELKIISLGDRKYHRLTWVKETIIT
ncbi:F-box protein HRT3 [Cyberlindnera fabianii]|uniref:F-box protein HRT3 n=1 Tax=Cyberlindnera fabianii TaxID=36022 RepID=A0A1V2L9B1_CYBFA|nr:F-box protein HRT3 [Cyberlindnera fabianii]